MIKLTDQEYADIEFATRSMNRPTESAWEELMQKDIKCLLTIINRLTKSTNINESSILNQVHMYGKL